MKKRFKIFKTTISLVAVVSLLPVVAFAQIKTTVTAPAEGLSNFIVAPAPTTAKTAPTSVKTIPTQTITTDIAKELLQTQTTKVLSPTSPTLVAPTKTAAPSTGITAPMGGQAAPTSHPAAPIGSAVPQKTVTTIPTASTRARTISAPVTAERYAAAQVIYQARNLAALQAAADASADGTAEGLPLKLAGIPGVPTIAVVAQRGDGVTFTVSGGGTYDIRGIVLDTESATLASFRDSVFTVAPDKYKNLGAVAVLITYIPEETVTFAPGTGGIVLPPPTGAVPITPGVPTPTKPIAVQPVAPGAPEAVPIETFELTLELTLPLVAIAPPTPTPAAPVEPTVPPATPPVTPSIPKTPSEPVGGGVVHEIPLGEEPEEIIEGPSFAEATEGEEGFFEDVVGAVSGGAEAIGDFFDDLFGPEAPAEEAPEEEPVEETIEAEIEFEPEDIPEFVGDVVIESIGLEPEEGEPDEELEEALGFDFTDFGVFPEEFRDEEIEEEVIGDLGFDFGDLAVEGELEKAVADEEFFRGDSEEIFVSEEEGPFEFFELFEPDFSAPVVPDYAIVENDVVVMVPLDGLSDMGEELRVVSLTFAPIAGGSGLEFSEPVGAADVVTFTIPRAVLGVLGADMRVLLKTAAILNGHLVVSTDVLGTALNE